MFRPHGFERRHERFLVLLPRHSNLLERERNRSSIPDVRQVSRGSRAPGRAQKRQVHPVHAPVRADRLHRGRRRAAPALVETPGVLVSSSRRARVVSGDSHGRRDGRDGRDRGARVNRRRRRRRLLVHGGGRRRVARGIASVVTAAVLAAAVRRHSRARASTRADTGARAHPTFCVLLTRARARRARERPIRVRSLARAISSRGIDL